LPGPIDDPLFAGCHQLIQQGAKLVCNPKEVLEELNFPKNRL
jgi:DNA processing protein